MIVLVVNLTAGPFLCEKNKQTTANIMLDNYMLDNYMFWLTILFILTNDCEKRVCYDVVSAFPQTYFIIIESKFLPH